MRFRVPRWMRRRKWLTGVVVVLLLAGGAAAYLMLSGDDDDEPAASLPGGEEAAPDIYYVEGNVLEAISPGETDGTQIHEGISPSARLSPEGRFLTWVAFAGPAQPITHIFAIETGELTTVGGTDPTWKPDGSSLALIRPTEEVTCEEDGCDGPSQVVLYSPDEGETERISPYIAEWTLHGWIDDRIVGEMATQEESTLLIDPEAETQPIWVTFPAADITSVSPDGNWITARTPNGPMLFEVVEEESPTSTGSSEGEETPDGESPDGEGSPDSDETPEDGVSPEDEISPQEEPSPEDDDGRSRRGRRRRGGRLLPVSDRTYSFEPVESLGEDIVYNNITWRDDSSALAAAAASRGQPEKVTRLVEIDGAEITDLDIPEPQAGMFWSPGGGGLVFTVLNLDENQLEATYCQLDGSECTTYIAWQTGTSVVGVVPDGEDVASEGSDT